MRSGPMTRNIWLPYLHHALLALAILALLTPVGHTEDDALSAIELYRLGQKHTGQPVEQRLQQLEANEGYRAPAYESLEYRKARLLAANQQQIPFETRRQAISAYNHGVDASSAGDAEAAMEAYRQALSLDPSLIQAYNNLANLLEQSQRLEEAILVYEKALRIDPDNALLHRNAGVMYERLGRVDEAHAAYRHYLTLMPPGSDPVITGLVDEYETNIAHDGGNDYLELTTASSDGRRMVWPKAMRPIAVYVSMDTPDQLAFLPVIHEAMADWEDATEQALRFQETRHGDEARIVINLQPGPLETPNRNVGHAQYRAENRRNLMETLRVDININTGNADGRFSEAERIQQVRRLVLHELGHAIGIWGHSPNPRDIMYSHPKAAGLSDRDIQTIRQLYGG